MLKWLGHLAASTDERLELLRSKDAEQRAERWLLRGQIGAVIILGFVALVAVFQLAGASETISATARNLGLIVIAPIGIWLAFRRTTDATRQVETQIRGQQSDRSQTAIQNMESSNEASRIAAIQELEQLRRENLEAYDLTVRRILAEYASGEKDSSVSEMRPFHQASIVPNARLGRSAERMIWRVIERCSSEPYSLAADERPIIRNTDCPLFSLRTKNMSNFAFVSVNIRALKIEKVKTNDLFFQSCTIQRIHINTRDEIIVPENIEEIFFDCHVEEITFSARSRKMKNAYKNLFDSCELPSVFDD